MVDGIATLAVTLETKLGDETAGSRLTYAKSGRAERTLGAALLVIECQPSSQGKCYF
jgi:hypothetical protein